MVTITKDELKVIKFEKNLVEAYHRYLKLVKELNMKVKKANFEHDLTMYKKFKKCIFTSLQKCFDSLWHFNHFRELMDIYVRFYNLESCQTALK